MALGVLVEAGSRLAAENTRSKASRAEQELRNRADVDATAREAARLAAAEASRRAREWSRLAADEPRLRDFVAGLPLSEVAQHWVRAAPHASEDATAATVLAACEKDLGRRVPGLMDFYRLYRDDGVSRVEAMAYAARDFDRTRRGPARRHGGRAPVADVLSRIGEDLEQEIGLLAGGLDEVGRARLLRNLQDDGWSAQSLSYVQSLLERAAAEHRTASTMAGVSDDPATTVDEHQAAQAAVTAVDGRAGDDAADAAAVATATRASHPAQVAAQSFPVPAQKALTAHPSALPKPIPAARPTRRRSR